MAVVILPSATETDALSTALLTLGAGSLDAITNLRPGMKTLLLAEAGSSNVETRGIPFP
jgi:thiamine biosynthesis lipoprotein ApbE